MRPTLPTALSLEETLLSLQKKATQGSLSVYELLQILGGKGKPLILLFLSFPFCQPIQIPGLSIPFGLAIALIGLKMAFGKRIWLPKRILEKQIRGSFLKKTSQRLLRWKQKIDPWIYPRLLWATRFPPCKIANGLLIAYLGIFLLLLVPFSNIPTAWALLFIALGTLEEDGLLILIGYLLSIGSTLLLIYLLFELDRYL